MRAYALAWLDLATDKFEIKSPSKITKEDAEKLACCFRNAMHWWGRFRKRQEQDFIKSFRPSKSFVGKCVTAPWPSSTGHNHLVMKPKLFGKWGDAPIATELGKPCDCSKLKRKK